ncbi:putative DNA topoisomerase II [Tripterygium wilfordii]|uniref:Putative DNA topoisomerase II n=1 Tax=Tripterygium wilfordii TaxID=458696 RepID=A0A7J7CQQ7_TRIWF|nr:putative DNA topoisomerase II [Tripterygium wilfordii]
MDTHVTDALAGKKEPSKRGAAKKNLPTKSKTLDVDSEEDEILELKERLAAYNLEAESAAEVPRVQESMKEPRKRGAAAQKKPLVTVSEISDGEDHIDLNDDEDVDLEVVNAKKGGKKAAGNAMTVKPPAATKKSGQATKQPEIGQKLVTEMLMPAESSRISPDKKVRKMRASPYKKKSGSVLVRVDQKDKDPEIDESMASASTTDNNTEEMTETLPARARPQRTNRRQTTYVLSDSESEKATDDSDFDEEEEED